MATELDLLALHKAIRCGTCGAEVKPAIGQLHQSGPPLPAAVFSCIAGNCEWERSVRLDMPNGVRVQLLDVGKDTISVGLEVEV